MTDGVPNPANVSILHFCFDGIPPDSLKVNENSFLMYNLRRFQKKVDENLQSMHV